MDMVTQETKKVINTTNTCVSCAKMFEVMSDANTVLIGMFYCSCTEAKLLKMRMQCSWFTLCGCGHHTLPPFRTLAETAREVVGCDVVLAWDVLNVEAEWLQCQVPPGNPSIRILHPSHPLKRFMISLQGEFSTQEVIPERVDGPFDSQCLLFHG